jgi:hypothetical protein
MRAQHLKSKIAGVRAFIFHNTNLFSFHTLFIPLGHYSLQMSQKFRQLAKNPGKSHASNK